MQWKATGSVQRTASRPDQRWIGATCARREAGSTRWSFPKIRAPVETWTSARTTAAVANHALRGDRRREHRGDDVGVGRVRAREHVQRAIEPRETTRYDRHVSRLVVVPLVPAVSASRARPSRSRSGTRRGRALRRQRPARSCSATSTAARPSSSRAAPAATAPTARAAIGPRLQGLPISIAAVKAQIDNGGGTMPAGSSRRRREGRPRLRGHADQAASRLSLCRSRVRRPQHRGHDPLPFGRDGVHLRYRSETGRFRRPVWFLYRSAPSLGACRRRRGRRAAVALRAGAPRAGPLGARSSPARSAPRAGRASRSRASRRA